MRWERGNVLRNISNLCKSFGGMKGRKNPPPPLLTADITKLHSRPRVAQIPSLPCPVSNAPLSDRPRGRGAEGSPGSSPLATGSTIMAEGGTNELGVGVRNGGAPNRRPGYRFRETEQKPKAHRKNEQRNGEGNIFFWKREVTSEGRSFRATAF